MMASALVFAGIALVIGGLFGFLLGQARAHIYYEGRLRAGEAGRAALESQLTNMRYFLRTAGLEYPPAAPPASADTERE
jgi:hypothetical protein